ncbi:class I SAM-dependent DNA methyltransferase [Streptomyces flaveolus]|uniref:class I SAM-dependent DNA methyltransferase n=1 Tax=Streptomyces flaveolus TaxID=67297 RepID=UPI0037032D3C
MSDTNVAEEVRRSYDALADAYDVVTGATDYDHWVAVYEDLISRHGAPGKRLVDLGCGTGKAAIRLSAHGFEVTGVDLSPGMIRAARAKPGADRVQFHVGDLQKLPDLGRPFAVAVTLGEPLNHLPDRTALENAFRSVSETLDDDGLFVLDMNTIGFYQRVLDEVLVDESDGSVVLWRGRRNAHDPQASDVCLDRFTSSDGHVWERSTETFPYTYFSPETVEEVLDGAGFTQLAVHGLNRAQLHPVVDQERDRKYLVVARKSRPAA